jgi:hypothetical protein
MLIWMSVRIGKDGPLDELRLGELMMSENHFLLP